MFDPTRTSIQTQGIWGSIVPQERDPIRTQIKRRRGLEVPRQRASEAQLEPWRLEFQNSPGRHRHSVPDEAISV